MIDDRLYDWATAGTRETRPRYVVRVALDMLWSARCAVSRWRRGVVLCPECNGGGYSAGGALCGYCGGICEIEREPGS